MTSEQEHKISTVDAALVPYVWPRVEPILSRALVHSNDRIDRKSQFDSLINGTDHLWVITKGDEIVATVILQIATYPTGIKMLLCLFCAGKDFALWGDDLHEKLVSFAAENNCTGMELTGRKGWTRLLRQWNWKTEYTVFRKDIDYGI